MFLLPNDLRFLRLSCLSFVQHPPHISPSLPSAVRCLDKLLQQMHNERSRSTTFNQLSTAFLFAAVCSFSYFDHRRIQDNSSSSLPRSSYRHVLLILIFLSSSQNPRNTGGVPFHGYSVGNISHAEIKRSNHRALSSSKPPSDRLPPLASSLFSRHSSAFSLCVYVFWIVREKR